MSDSKHDQYSEIINEEEHDAFLDNSFRGRAKSEALAIESWILYASLSFILLFVGGVIGYNLRPSTAGRGLAFADMSQLNIYDARASTSYSLETAVHLEEMQNIGYMASLGLFHQIHCLNMLRKFIYLDYYKEKTPDWFSQPYLRAHADHCVDMIREAIMCHGDTSLIVYHWINGYKDPVPDFSTMVRSTN
ncbi:Cyclochlorotine biosynthesis protein O [Beauveria bassiana]|nr:Cyclochlorotine biosynthesis protein O [Beauveria bassiana]